MKIYMPKTLVECGQGKVKRDDKNISLIIEGKEYPLKGTSKLYKFLSKNNLDTLMIEVDDTYLSEDILNIDDEDIFWEYVRGYGIDDYFEDEKDTTLDKSKIIYKDEPYLRLVECRSESYLVSAADDIDAEREEYFNYFFSLDGGQKKIPEEIDFLYHYEFNPCGGPWD